MKFWIGIKWDVLQCVAVLKPKVLETLILYDNLSYGNMKNQTYNLELSQWNKGIKKILWDISGQEYISWKAEASWCL